MAFPALLVLRQKGRKNRLFVWEPGSKPRRRKFYGAEGDPEAVARYEYDRRDSYALAIKRACKRAGVPVFTPYQLRKLRGNRDRPLIRSRCSAGRARTRERVNDPRLLRRSAARSGR